MSVTVLPAVDLRSGRVTLFLRGRSHLYFCAQPHQLIDALTRAVRSPVWGDDGVLTVRVAVTGERAGRELRFTLQPLPLLRSTETRSVGEPSENPRNFALQ
ncbi:hypothetical protein [Arthrobacter sp. RAF14]|uniref:hypothetical protein n=1 Tax=Arthrobacter sp. RAF14 TaxID=3233051 RepID=UPI003F8E3EF1